MPVESHVEALASIRTRLHCMPLADKFQLIAILRQLDALGDQLADLRLFLPEVEVRFYGLGDELGNSVALSPEAILDLLCDGS